MCTPKTTLHSADSAAAVPPAVHASAGTYSIEPPPPDEVEHEGETRNNNALIGCEPDASSDLDNVIDKCGPTNNYIRFTDDNEGDGDADGESSNEMMIVFADHQNVRGDLKSAQKGRTYYKMSKGESDEDQALVTKKLKPCEYYSKQQSIHSLDESNLSQSY